MSIANYLTALDAQRDQLARNLTAMGVQASESEKLNTLVPKVLQIPSGRPEITLFQSGNDALATYGESIYTFYIDGYRSIAGFADVYPHFCCAENAYALYYNQPDFNWGAVIFTMCITPVRITPASRILLTYKSGATDAGEMWLVRKSSQQMSPAETARYIHEKLSGGEAMIKTYGYTDNTQLSPHFNAQEFRCKCGREHDFQIDDDLITKLEALYSTLNCSKIIVTSGFRCVAHDKSVGSSGTGQHTLGKAADICCYGQDGQPISSKTVCCKAQDTGFTGIANITAAYIYTHVDVRSGGKWYGDEVHGNSSVTDDFYKYFGGEDMKGIDVSVHNGKIDWQKVKAAGIDFAILRAGYGKLAKQKDDRFEKNYAGAKAAGIPVGAYWYSYAMDEDEARQEADVFLSVIKGKQFEFPVYFDLEEKKQFDLGKDKVSAIMRAFLKKVESAGYFVGLYGSASSLTTHTADDIKSRYTIWLAHWCDQTNYSGAYGIWQHSEKGRVDGINDNVDLDVGYKDFTTIIKAKGLNGYGKEPNPPAPAAEDGITVEVTVDGKKYSGKLNKA